MPGIDLLFLASRFPPDRGGVEKYNAKLCEHLALRGHSVEVLVIRTDARADAISFPFAVERLLAGLSPRAVAGFVCAAIGRHRPDAVLLSRVSRGYAPLVSALRRAGLPTLLFVHGLRERDARKGRIGRWVKRRALGFDFAATTFANSRHTLESLRRFGQADARLGVAYPGVEPSVDRRSEAHRAEIRNRYGLQGRRVLITVARLVPHKSIDLVIRMMPEVLRRVPDAHYLIVGDGGERPNLEALCRTLGLQERITFAGAPEDVAPFYSAGDLYVMVSCGKPGDSIPSETFGMVYAEAGASGLPSVATRVGGVPEVVLDGRTGYLVEPGRTEEAAARVVELLADPAGAAAMGEEARRYITERFTWSATAAEVERRIYAALGGDAPADAGR